MIVHNVYKLSGSHMKYSRAPGGDNVEHFMEAEKTILACPLLADDPQANEAGWHAVFSFKAILQMQQLNAFTVISGILSHK